MQLEQKSIGREDILKSYPGFKNVRTVSGDLTDLKASIADKGMITPLTVWEINDDGDKKYVLLCGWRRLSAIEALIEDDSDYEDEFEVLTCSIFDGDLDGALALNMVENLEREDLNPADEIDGVGYLIERVGTQVKVGEVLNRSQPWVSNRWNMYVGLGRNAKEALRHGRVNLKQAKVLSKLLKKDGSADVDAQEDDLAKMLGDKEDDGERNKGTDKKVRTIKSKSDMANLLAKFMDAEVELDPQHRLSVCTVLAWYFGQIEDVDEAKPLPENVIKEITALTTAPSKDRVKDDTSKKVKADEKAMAAKAKAAAKADKEAAKAAEATKKEAAEKIKADERLAAEKKKAADKKDKVTAAAAAKGNKTRAKVEAAVPAPADEKPRRKLPVVVVA